MATTNQDRVGKAMELLRDGLGQFIEREVEEAFGERAHTKALEFVPEDKNLAKKRPKDWDAAALLKLMWEAWNVVFKKTLGAAERSLVSELRTARNRWAHQEPLAYNDVYRVLDSVARLLNAVSAAPQALEIEKARNDLLRLMADEGSRRERRTAASNPIESSAATTLTPWREVISPHSDVVSGTYQQAEFAADLWQVHVGQGSSEYRDPAEFYRRTYLTASLSELLANGAKRLAGKGGDPVVQLQTNFGGGKTHSMLALYHMCSGTPPVELLGLDDVLERAQVTKLPKVNRVVLVGNKISPGNPTTKEDGTEVRTLWGELAWQLGLATGGIKEARKAFNKIKKDDELATNPGDRLRELFDAYSPCLILVDEWVSYARQLHDKGDLPGGSFETQFTFAQAVTESAKLAKQCLLVISLPASDTAGSPHTVADDVEVGGQRGREALDRLRNVVGRVEASWRPATAEEGFEIVRRRLFEPLFDQKKFRERDAVVRAFFDLYKNSSGEFPPDTHEKEYERRMQAAYPIHPELFDRLYGDWSTLLKFQRTRGVLRLMAAVIHWLWENGDKNPLILPCHVPIDDPRVQSELTRYLSDNWVPVIERDVDGPNSVPRDLDRMPNLGKYSAARRVARTIFIGSAPTEGSANRGIEDRDIRLGCVMPGENISAFGDALRRLASGATYLYPDGRRYWYATQPTVAKLAADRAEQLKHEHDKVLLEIERRVREDTRVKGDFARVHALPASGADVPDDYEARLVVVGPEAPYSKDGESDAQALAERILESRGTVPRALRNTLVFLAADQSRLTDLEDAVRQFLAWDAIVQEQETLNLSKHQANQAEAQRMNANQSVAARLPETYQWLLVPSQANPSAAITWAPVKLSGSDALAKRASRKLTTDESLISMLGPTRLELELNKVPLWRGDHVSVRQLVDDFASYLYLPRLRDSLVVLQSISEGVGSERWAKETFAYAESFDETNGSYRGLKTGTRVSVREGDAGLVVKSVVAQAQLTAERTEEEARIAGADRKDAASGDADGGRAPTDDEKKTAKPSYRRFHGSVNLDGARVGRDAAKIAEEVIAHLVGIDGAKVRVALEIEAEFSGDVPERVVRVVTENARTLKFGSQGFEKE